MLVDGTGMNLADAPGADQGESHGGVLLLPVNGRVLSDHTCPASLSDEG
ncbi:hypothetical protein A8U91_04649 [Halomonas elongata]|uniref:Uncharacterized protein n=1 Tax=Halomonas elongata TaxID=2746 RepID=A0A1B8NZY4_HALEL|nr:hypothetical protein A8U91_04649 [Halomonas elongata]